MPRESSVSSSWFHKLRKKVTCIFLKSNPSLVFFFLNMLPTLEHRDLIQSNYQMCRFLFPLHHFSVCNIRICSVLIQLLGQAQNLHMYTRSNATGDWTLYVTVSHPSKGFSAPENCSGVMQGMITPKKMPVHTNSRQKSRSTFVGILVLEGLI